MDTAVATTDGVPDWSGRRGSHRERRAGNRADVLTSYEHVVNYLRRTGRRKPGTVLFRGDGRSDHVEADQNHGCGDGAGPVYTGRDGRDERVLRQRVAVRAGQLCVLQYAGNGRNHRRRPRGRLCRSRILLQP